jgi:manganese transport protein
VLAATVFFKTGRTEVAEIKDAHRLLAPLLGTSLAPILFAIALIAAGQSSTITGTLAGQIIMEGYLRLRINPWLRRLLTRLLAITPAIAVILLYGDEKIDALLILSQVILSLQLGFAIIPLIHFVSDKNKMEAFTIRPVTKILSWLVTIVLVFLNLKMVGGSVMEFLVEDHAIYWKILIVLGAILLLILLVIVTVYPWLQKIKNNKHVAIHPEVKSLDNLAIPEFNLVAVALDFSAHDKKLIAFAIGQGKQKSSYLLIHVVESATARVLGNVTDDLETRKDEEQLAYYVQQLAAQGYQVTGKLGYHGRKEEIVQIVKEVKADLLVMGAHGHAGVKDWLYGATINKVRHELKIPVLIVHSSL